MSFDATSSVSSENNLSYLNQENEIKPIVLRAQRAPLTTDRRYKIGTLWVDVSNNASYQLTSVAAGIANWVLLGMGGGDLETLTGDSGGAVVPDGAGNINIVGGDLFTVAGGVNTLTITETTGAYPITPYVVGVAGEAGYTTIQAALDAANAAGGGLVQVQSGSYTENLILYDNTAVVGNNPVSSVILTGVHTPPATGSFFFSSIFLNSATDIFNSAVAGSASLGILRSAISVTAGYTYNVLNWTGPLTLINSFSVAGGNGEVNNTGGSSINFRECQIGDNGNTLITSGAITATSCNFRCALDLQSGGDLRFSACEFDDNVTLGAGVTAGYFSGCQFDSGATQAITMNSANDILIFSSSITSSNNPSIGGTGAGTLQLSSVSFESDNNIAGTVTIGGGDTRTGSLETIDGGIKVNTVGSGLDIAEGANARQGTATLVGGTLVVPTTAVTATSRIFLTSQIDGGTPGFLRVSATIVGASFTILSSNALDTSTVAWLIMEPA